MFNVEDIVTYGANGVCKVVAIEKKEVMGTKKDYLVLEPVNGGKLTFYVPVDNENMLCKMRKLLSEDEINNLIDSMPDEKLLWIDSERVRKERYRQIITNGNHSELIGMIKAIYFVKKDREEKGKKLYISDERFLKEAEKILYEEFQYVLNLSEQDLMPYIYARIERKTVNEQD